MSLTDALEPLRRRFLARAAEDLAALQAHLEGVQILDAAALRFTVHRLAGSAGTFGYAALSDAAGRVEDDLLNGPERPDASLRRLLDLLSAIVR